MSKECIYDVCHRGPCKKPTVAESDFCEYHSSVKCSSPTLITNNCENQAVGDCHGYHGSFVCGKPLCIECKKIHARH